ncbi:MAG: sulfatase-like hydrolase/transferase [Bacteroidota bacterium]
MRQILILLLLTTCSSLFSQKMEYQTLQDIPYYPSSVADTNAYIKERCVMDIYYPTDKKHFSTVVWFHGGGLRGGSKFIPQRLKEQGIAIVSVNYRLYPKIKAPVYIEDAAAAVAWTLKNIQKYGGDPELVFVSGHSAGGYLASMVGLDKKYLAVHDVDANSIAGLIPFSGHAISHFTYRDELGIPGTQAIVDEYAPLYHVRADAPPYLMITGNRELELLGRYEENAYMMRMMKLVGHQETQLMELDGYGHNMVEPAYPLLLKEVRRITTKKRRPNIVFIIADDASWKHFGTYGTQGINTPNLDRLAKEGIVFENAFVSASSCSPSRGAILTGRNGFELKEGATLWGYLPKQYPTYVELLQNVGYRTGSTGKGWGPGFDVGRKEHAAGKRYNSIKKQLFEGQFDPLAMSNIDYSANFESFLNTTDSTQPFCFWVGTYEPHRGYTEGVAKAMGTTCNEITVPDFLPDAPAVRADICEYWAEIEYIDQQVGEVFEILREKNQLENTLILFASDNGMPFPRAKATLYDYGTHVPLIAWWGEQIEGSRRVDDMISYTDIAPTLLDAAGAGIPWEVSGRSFLRQLKSLKQGTVDAQRDRVYTYRERHVLYPDSKGYTTPARAIRTREYLLVWNMEAPFSPRDVDGGPTKSYMMDHQQKEQDLYNKTFAKRPSYELYHIPSDPYQLKNLADNPKYQNQLERMKKDLVDYLTKRNDPRMLQDEDPFRHNPYFGRFYASGILKEKPGFNWYTATPEEKEYALRKAYERINEVPLFEEMIRRQRGRFSQ